MRSSCLFLFFGLIGALLVLWQLSLFLLWKIEKAIFLRGVNPFMKKNKSE